MDSIELRVTLGRTIRALRAKQGYSQEAFANAVGLHRTYVGGLERGERNVGLTNLARVADALGMSPSELLALTEREIASEEEGR